MHGELNIYTMKYYEFLMVILALIGCIGGIGYCIYEGALPVAAGIVVLSILAYPTWIKYFNDLNS